MAPANRRPGTRSHPSSAQEMSSEDCPLLELDGDENQPNEASLAQQNDVDTIGNTEFYSPQYDNPSALMPDNDDDYALKEYMASQEQISNSFNQQVQEEFQLNFNNDDSSAGDNDINEDEEVDNNNSFPAYTQNTLDAASILVGGFDSSNAANNDDTSTNSSDANNQSSAAPSVAERLMPSLLPSRLNDNTADAEFVRKHNEFNRKHGTDVSFDLPTAVAAADAIVNSLPPDDDAELAKQISSGLQKDGIVGLSAEEHAHVDNCDEGKNNKKHSQNQSRLESMFFDTIQKHGGHLAVLAMDQKIDSHHTVERGMVDKRFCSVVGGDKNPDKHKTFNDCSVLCSQKWHCTTGKNKGQKLQPSTFDKHLEQLAIMFTEKGIKHNHTNDFNKNGQFHGAVKTMWGKICEKDPSFGTGSDRARTDPQLCCKFIQAIRNKKMCPHENPEHLVICIVFIFGFYLGLRGSTEHMNSMTDQLCLGECSMEDGQDLAGLRWGGVKTPFSKMNQLKFCLLYTSDAADE